MLNNKQKKIGKKKNETLSTFTTPTDIPFHVEVRDKVSARKNKKSKETKRGTKKDVCDVCGTKTKSGHVKCELCGQWKHVKCVGKSFQELKNEGYKCPKC